MGTGKVQFKPIDTRLLTSLDDFEPGVFAVFFHDRRDQDPIRKTVFAFLEFFDPDFERSIADELNIFPANHFPFVI
jgi:hypothetical protein